MGEAIRNICFDSETIKYLNLERRKTKRIISDVLATVKRKEITSLTKANCFSLGSDSTPLSSNKSVICTKLYTFDFSRMKYIGIILHLNINKF